MQNKSVKKNEWGQKCVNYLDLPVCPNCGSPNLHELEQRGNVTNCICDRCDSKCWFDDSFSTEGRDTVRFTDNLKIIESTKKSQPATKSFNDMVQKQRNKNIQKFNKEDGSFDKDELQTIWSGLDDMEHAYFKVDDILCPNVDMNINQLMNRIWESYHELRSYLTGVL